ncbi:MAG: AMIN domain-containing protein, partial [Longimicrobiales bacterium]
MTSILTFALSAIIGAAGPVTGVSIHSAASQTEIVVSVDGQVEVQDFLLQSPNRLVLDLMGARHALDQESYSDVNRGGVKAIRTSQYSDEIVRLVLELDGPVQYEIKNANGAVQVTLENPAGPFESWHSSGGPVAGLPPAEPGPDLTVAAPLGDVELTQIQEVRRPITVSFSNTPVRDVLFTFAEFANRSIVPGSDVEGIVSAEIRDQPWDLALQTVLEAHGLVAQELETGIIRVDNVQNLFNQETVLPLDTRPFRVNYANASELQEPISAL